MTDNDLLDLAHDAYNAYCFAIGGKAVNGEDLPPFADIPQHIKNAWVAAVVAVKAAIR